MDIGNGYISFIVNPKAGASSANRLVRQFRKYLDERDYDVRMNFTKSLAHAEQLGRAAAADEDCKMVATAGGDGTIREVVQGLAGSDTPLLVVPCGTENLLGNEMGFNEKVEMLIKAFEGDTIRSLDLGQLDGQCFTCLASFGFDGDVIKRFHETRKGHINHLDYFWPVWRTFWGHKFPHFKVVVDDKEIFNGRGMVFVGNISRYAIGLEILGQADYSDGLLDVCVYKCSSRLHLIKHAVATVLKMHSFRGDVVYCQGKDIELTSNTAVVNSEVDGDPGPCLPVKISIIPQAVKVIVPLDAKPAGIRTRLMRMIG